MPPGFCTRRSCTTRSAGKGHDERHITSRFGTDRNRRARSRLSGHQLYDPQEGRRHRSYRGDAGRTQDHSGSADCRRDRTCRRHLRPCSRPQIVASSFARGSNSNPREEMMKLSKYLAAGLLFMAPATFAAPPAADKEKDVDRMENAGTVIDEILNVPDDIPQDLLDKARCVVILPSVLKAAFVVGGSYGRGVMVCRTGTGFKGPWGAPAMYALEGGSVGFQIGGQATDFVILVMNDRGASSLLKSKVKLGADASVAAGPKGRDASADTDAYLRAEMLSYSRSRGVFAGISLEGSTLRPDNDGNRNVYGKDASASASISESKYEAPPEGRKLASRLQKASPTLKP